MFLIGKPTMYDQLSFVAEFPVQENRRDILDDSDVLRSPTLTHMIPF